MVTAEIGDTWIYGASTDPVKVRATCSLTFAGPSVDAFRLPSSALRSVTDTRTCPCALATPIMPSARTAMPVSELVSE